MIAVMSSTQQHTLGSYIREKLGPRSIRAMATYAKIGVGTASNLINDKTEKPDPETLQKVAEYLDVPVENLFRLAGYIDEDDPETTVLLSELEHLMRLLPSESQRRILEMARLEYRITKPDDDRGQAD